MCRVSSTLSSDHAASGPTFARVLLSACTAVVLLAFASAFTVGPRGLWRFANYDFKLAEFWPDALRIGRTLQQAPDLPEPRWLVVGSSIVLYDVVSEAVHNAARTDVTSPSVVKLAAPNAVFTDAATLTQLAHRAAPVRMAVAGVHPRDFDTSVDPRTTLVARMFDHAGVNVQTLVGGKPARRLRRAVATIWPAFRVRGLQTRVFHALVPNAPAFGTANESDAMTPPEAAQFDWGNAPTTDNGQLAELRAWAQWCTDHGIRPVVVYFPVRLHDSAPLWPAAQNDAWITALDAECDSAAIVFINARDAAPADAFFDFNHLHEEGAVAFSTWLGKQLAEL